MWQKKRRADGLPYETSKKRREAKNPKPIDCTKCKYQCTAIFSEEDRMLLCRSYWSQDYAAKKNMILSLVSVEPIKTIKVNRKRLCPRSNTKKYFFESQGLKKQVCQNFFCKTFCISACVITEAVSNRNCLGVYQTNNDPRPINQPCCKQNACRNDRGSPYPH